MAILSRNFHMIQDVFNSFNWNEKEAYLAMENFNFVSGRATYDAESVMNYLSEKGVVLEMPLIWSTPEYVKFSLENGAKFDDKAFIALNNAAVMGKIDVVEELLNSGIDPNGNKNHVPINEAVKHGMLDYFEILISHGETIETKDSADGNTPILNASMFNSQNVLEKLIESRADMNSQNNDGDSALIIATKNNLIAQAKILIKSGADESIKNKEGKIAYDIAKKLGYNEIADLLSS